MLPDTTANEFTVVNTVRFAHETHVETGAGGQLDNI